jgi:hypothetical protein
MSFYNLLPFLDYIFSFRDVFIVYIFILLQLSLRFGLKLSINTFYNILFLIIPILWSFGLSSNFINRDFQRSIFYLSLPPLTFLIGASYGRFINLSKVYNFIIYYGFTSVVIYIVLSLFNGNFSNLLSPKLARSTFYFPKPLFCVISIYLLFFYQKVRGRVLFLFFNMYGLFISGSRTYFLLLLIFFIGRYFKFSLKYISFFLVLISFVFIGIYYSGNFDNLFTELTFSSDNSSLDIGSQYRGFESFKAVEKILSGSINQMLFGFGLNENIDLGIDVDLGGFVMSEIPLLHNGFLYSIVRIGLVGLLFYFILFYRVLVDKSDYYSRHERYMIVVLVFSLIISNFVINSFYNMEFAVSWFLLGYYTNKQFSDEKMSF